ncbi:Las1-like-domain-containing protein [Gautieria morchelliformis]|nr:Las1-like-domain-containing protein [Gautieria morchelliformis]
MKLPKRVPWASLSEVEQICSWIYADEGDIAAKVHAVNRLAAWKASTALPHSLESTLSLLTVILQDEDYSNTSSRSATLSLRQSYSLALIRLVNGLVDPLQHGVYARSIASIAAQIGLPLWLVELRHASTHEELPSLELLREGTREAMSWLLRNYFLPTISPVNQSVADRITLPPVSPLLAQYKKLLKMTNRDTSLKSQSKPELARILRDIEQWILEAKVAASMVEFDIETPNDEEDEKERWALENLCDALSTRGGLVPVSKRKRPSSLHGLKVPSSEHVALWVPLVQHVYTRYTCFPSILLSRIINRLLSSSQSSSASSAPVNDDVHAVDPTYDHTLASWALWIVDQWGDEPYAECESSEVVKELLLGLGREDNKIVRSLLVALSENDPRIRDRVHLLSTAMQPSSQFTAWEGNALDIMSERLSQLRPGSLHSGFSPSPPQDSLEDVEISTRRDTSAESSSAQSVHVRGWRLLDKNSGWKPCPIGVYNGTNF